MLIAILQTAAAGVAGVLLFLLWRLASRPGRAVAIVVAGGLLARSFGGQILYWVSYLNLPFGRSLQLGDGFWFFALDGKSYYQIAATAAAAGPGAILSIDPTVSSVTYVQTLAAFVFLFGHSAAAGILLNLFCYVGACAVLVAMLTNRSVAALRTGVVAVAALSLSPSAILWAAQPLKDTFVIFLIVAFVGACFSWQREWMEKSTVDRSRLLAISAATVSAVLTLYAIAGTRWYLAFAFVLTSTAFLLLVSGFARAHKKVSVVAALLLIVALSQVFVLGAGPKVPGPIRTVLRQVEKENGILGGPSWVFAQVESARQGFERAGGSTTIRLAAADERRAEVEQKRKAAASQRPPEAVAPSVDSAATAVAAATNSAVRDAVASPGSSPSLSAEPAPAVTLEPQAPAARFAAGLVALVVPRFIAESAGFVEIGGGRGLWLFADLDTIFFDAVLLWCAVVVYRRLRGFSPKNPISWLVLLTTGLVGVPIVYAVTNFGTLFRHRSMIFIGVLLIPLLLYQFRERERDVPLANVAEN